jgi:two-component system sensor histidine kinase DegS
MKLFQDSRSDAPEVLQLANRIATVCDKLCGQYNLQMTNNQLRLVIDRQADKSQQRLTITNSLWALSFVVNKQWLKAHLFPATNLIAKGNPETNSNQRLCIQLKGGKLLLDEDVEVEEQLDLLVLSLFEELVRRSQAAAQAGPKGRVALDGVSVMTAVRNLVHENQSLISQLLHQNEQIHNRIAADIHDQVLSDLMLLKKMLQKRSANDEEMQVLDDSMNYLRDICSGLSAKDLQTFGLLPCLNNLVKKMRRHTDMKVEYIQTGTLPRYAEEVTLQVFRIVQEALNNAIKHADGSKITVTVNGGTAECSFCVEDDGAGFSRDSHNPGLGLSILAERNALIQESCSSHLTVSAADPHGTKVLLVVSAPKAE